MKTVILLFFLSAIGFSQPVHPDIIVTDKDETINCYIKEITRMYLIFDVDNDERLLNINRVQTIWVSGLDTIYTEKAGFTKSEKEIDDYLTRREFSKRDIGLTIGSSLRSQGNKVQRHMAGSSSTISIVLGIEKSLKHTPLSFEFLFEAGLGGQIQNSYSETYGYIDLKLGAKWYVFAPQNKFNLVLNGGVSRISATVDDNADSDDNGFLVNSNFEFQDGKLKKSSDAFGLYMGIGLLYNISQNLGVLGSFQLSSHDLDFVAFKSNALGPGGSLKLIYYY